MILLATLAGAATARAAEPTTPTTAMSGDARAHYDRGLELYGDKDYTGAIRELDAGYALDPRREFLFAEAQAHRLNGDCKSAVPLYKKFLDSEPDDVQVNAAHIALARCAEQMATTSTPAPSAVPAPSPTNTSTLTPTVAPPITSTAAAASSAPRLAAPAGPWYQDLAGGVLLGAGAAALALGTGFTLAAFSARNDANQSSPTYALYESNWSTARSRSQVALAAFGSGAALTGAAIYRYLHVLHVQRGYAPTPSGRKLDAWAAPTSPTASGSAPAGIVAGVGGRF